MDITRLKLIINTVKYLKFQQVAFRFLYAFRKRFVSKEYNHKLKDTDAAIFWSNCIHKPESFLGNQTFSFLNINHDFETEIDWNYSNYGKLWTYNLNYFDFLNQEGIVKSDALRLIHNYIRSTEQLKDGLEPYPISLRCINWIKFLSKEQIKDLEIQESLFNQYLRLLDNLEYHLLGNHLLENGFSLLFGAYYFKEDSFYAKAKKIIEKELNEQIFKDGAHFELSPMYHQILLDRLLDCISLVTKNPWKDDIAFLSLMKFKARDMLNWIETVTFKNGDIPMTNDSAFGIAPSTKSIKTYAKKLKINFTYIQLGDSGYRKYNYESYELLVDVGQVGPSYQPGHAHADTFSFVLHSGEQPIIVDTGISTYNLGKIREHQRATRAHNTVTINGENSSDVWGGFRVGRRARITSLQEDDHSIRAAHDGYQKFGFDHTREFQFNNNKITIFDKISKPTGKMAKAHFNFHDSINVHISNVDKVDFGRGFIEYEGATRIHKIIYDLPKGFNKTKKASCIVVTFDQHLKTTIKL